jgi:thiol-disulfide isomerase/thioredoxin
MPTPTALARMIPLPKHELFESMFIPSESSDQQPLTKPVLITFSASWCGPCQKIDWDFLLDEFPEVPIYYCDIDVNKYTAGYCGVRSIPQVVMLLPALTEGKGRKATLVGPFQSSDTAKIATFIHTNLKK